jgi:hypothetical protein
MLDLLIALGISGRASLAGVICALLILLIVATRPRWYCTTIWQICPRRFYPLADFPEMAGFKENFSEIRAECVAQMSAPVSDVPRGQSVWAVGDRVQTADYISKTKDLYGWQPAWSPATTGANHKWVNMPFFVRHDGRLNVYGANCAACPTLACELSKIADRIQVAGFSCLRPSMRIAEHTDATGIKYGSAAYHLGLIVPDPALCSLTVDGQKIYQREGQAFIFESTMPHHASNWSSGDRVILYIDFLL